MGHNVGLSRETYKCGGGSGALQDSPNLRVLHSSNYQGFLLGRGGFLFCDSGVSPMLVSDTRPLEEDAWKPQLGYR